MQAVGIAVGLLWLGGCNPFMLFHCSPYGCAKAEDGRSRLQPVIDAALAYAEDRDAYPERADALVPDYLAQRPERPDWAPPEAGDWWWYERTATGFTVGFVYFGPGVNVCSWTLEAATWRCGGHY